MGSDVVVAMTISTVADVARNMTLFTVVGIFVVIVVDIVGCRRCRCVCYYYTIGGGLSRCDSDTVYIYIYIYIFIYIYVCRLLSRRM